ncbi:MAG: urease accessory protein [Natronomonas sp.]
MTDDQSVLTAFQLADSFLPVGGYSSSYALEQFVQSDRVKSATDLVEVLTAYLRGQVGPAELVALRAAHRAAGEGDIDALVRADRRLHAVTLPAEFRESATRSGARLCDIRQQTVGGSLLQGYTNREPPQQYPAVLGAVAAVDGIPERRACLVHAYSFCSDMLGAAQRLLSLGHTETQTALEELKPVVNEAVAKSTDHGLESMAPFAPLVEIQAAAHERADRRLFVS